MKEYKVIKSYPEKDAKGKPTGRRLKVGDVVLLSKKDGDRLANAKCVVLIEARINNPPENRRYR